MIRFLNNNRSYLYVSTLVLFLLVNLAASKLSWRIDLTAKQVNSLTASTKKILEELNNPLVIEAYITQDTPGDVKALIDPYLASLTEMKRVGGSKVRLTLINPNTEKLTKQAESRGIIGTPVEARERPDQVETKLGYFGVYLQLGEKSRVLSLVQDGGLITDFEYRILKEIKNLEQMRRESGVAFVHTRGSMYTRKWRARDDQNRENMFGYRAIFESESGFISDISLKEPVADSVRILLMTGIPDLDEKERYHLDRFLTDGGGVILLTTAANFTFYDETRRMMDASVGGAISIPRYEIDKMNAWLSRYGVTLIPGLIYEPHLGAPAYDFFGRFPAPVKNPFWLLYTRREGELKETPYPALNFMEQVVFPYASGMDIKESYQPNVRYHLLAAAHSSAHIKESDTVDPFHALTSKNNTLALGRELPVAVIAEGKFKSAFADNNSAETRRGNGRLVVIGSSAFVSDLFLRNESNLWVFKVNQATLTNIIELLQGDTDLVMARSKIILPDLLRYQNSDAFRLLFRWTHTLLLAVVVALIGIAVYFARYKSQRGS